MTTRAATDDWNAYWQSRASGPQSVALVGVGIETNAAIDACWAEIFAALGGSDRVIDLACGAGTALRAAAKAGAGALTGVDISEQAIAALATTLPEAQGIVASANRTGLGGASYDWVVSQFGFEYCGAQGCIKEIARISAPEGRFAAIMHMAGGGIANECARHLSTLEALSATNFIPRARKLFRALFDADTRPGQVTTEKANRAVEAFKPAMADLQALTAKTGPDHIAAHLYSGTARLYERRAKYAREDIEGWLTQMRSEIDAYAGRMSAMIASAQSEADMEALCALLSESGFAAPAFAPLDLAGDGTPAAWRITAGPKRG